MYHYHSSRIAAFGVTSGGFLADFWLLRGGMFVDVIIMGPVVIPKRILSVSRKKNVEDRPKTEYSHDQSPPTPAIQQIQNLRMPAESRRHND
ncbi:hypothetical protein VTL71DRAFT_6917 [Oculimacula yallundae]|uniref:Uncharacterized protein n=1 Tax=Oculimacula yallundae TaxID=86028 RepID=A0ABR4BV66_9HELO